MIGQLTVKIQPRKYIIGKKIGKYQTGNLPRTKF